MANENSPRRMHPDPVAQKHSRERQLWEGVLRVMSGDFDQGGLVPILPFCARAPKSCDYRSGSKRGGRVRRLMHLLGGRFWFGSQALCVMIIVVDPLTHTRHRMTKIWILTMMCTASPLSSCPTSPAWTDLPFRNERQCLDLGAFIARTQAPQGLTYTYSCEPR